MTATSEQTAEANFLWGHLVSHGLSDLGVTTVFFSPGSRATPLIIGCEKEKRLSCFPALDERTAAFLALGHAKRTNVPTAVICTSGSALTHWFPAVTEASYSGIPLLLLSADRPPELQECGAGQTINQINLFGSFVRDFHQSPLPTLEQDGIHDDLRTRRRACRTGGGLPQVLRPSKGGPVDSDEVLPRSTRGGTRDRRLPRRSRRRSERRQPQVRFHLRPYRVSARAA